MVGAQKSQKRIKLEENLEKAIENQRKVFKKKAELVSGVGTRNLSFKDFDDLMDTVTELSEQTELAETKISVICGKIETLTIDEENEYNADWDARIAEIDFDAAANPMKLRGSYLGMVNPAEPGKGVKETKFKGAMLMLAAPDGSLKRVFISSDEIYPDNPAAHLGEPVIQSKHSYNSKAIRGIFVVGYVNLQGEKFGYIPNGSFNTYRH